ncbi:MAG: M35 family metallo-endopeptidase [Massilia sp.]
MNWTRIWNAAFAVFAFALCMGAQAASNGVAVAITPDKQYLGKDDDLVVTVTITNTSSTPQYVLKWHTPFGGVEESLFDVTRDGLPVPYLGAHAKRPAPTAADYYLLKPGASHSAKVELSALYDLSVTGDYTIRYRTGSLDLFAGAPAAPAQAGAVRQVDQLESEAVSIWIDGRQPRGTAQALSLPEMQAAATGSLSFTSCTASQQSTIASAVSAGLSMVTDGDAYMAKGAVGARYTHWFGANDSTRVATVKSHFVALKDAFANKPITVDCGCKKTYYAYVYPTQPYKIYVCKAFWSAPMTGTDSKGGTLVHEMSHFNVVASTDDWVYGQSGAASLAISDPAKAIDNADSHEYFGENTPALK